MKHRIALGAVSIVLVAAIWLLVASRLAANGPVYQGRTGREWFNDYCTTNPIQATLAFRAMGSNAIPFLVNQIARKKSGWENFCERNYSKFPQSIRKHLSKPTSDNFRAIKARTALGELDKSIAIPGLLRLLPDENWKKEAGVLGALSVYLGPNDTQCIPILLNYLNSTNAINSCWAVVSLQHIGPDKRAIPALMNLVGSKDIVLRTSAMSYLREIDPKMAAKYEITDQKQATVTNSQPGLQPSKAKTSLADP